MKENEKVSWEDIAWSNMYSIEAMMNILEKKGLITKQEVLREPTVFQRLHYLLRVLEKENGLLEERVLVHRRQKLHGIGATN